MEWKKLKKIILKWIFNQLKAEDDAKNPKNTLPPPSSGTNKPATHYFPK